MNGVVLFFMFATLLVLIGGVVLMSIGGKLNQNLSNKLMVARVALQAMVLLMLLIMMVMAK